MRRAAVACAFVGLVAAAVAARSVLVYGVVFPGPGHVRLVDTDAYFHLRHVRNVARNFPRLTRVDSAWDFPVLQRSDAAGLFDVAVGGAAAAAGGRTDELALWRTAAWAPVAFLAAVLGALFALARRFVGAPLALWVVAAFVTHPGLSLPVTCLGYCDHHVAEMLCGLGTVHGFVHALDGTGLVRTLAGATPLIVFLFTWLGAPLYVPILGLAALAVLTVDEAAGERRRAAALARYAGAVGAGAALVAAVGPALVMEANALAHAFAALAVLGVLGYAHGAVADALARRGAGAWASAGGATALLVGAGVVVVAGTAHGRELAAYLLTAKTSVVSEHMPVGPRELWLLLGVPGVLAAAGLPALVRASVAGERLALVPVTCASAVTALWLITRDYGYQAPPLVALVAGLGIGAWAPRGARAQAALAAALALPLVAPFAGGAWAIAPWMPAQGLREIQHCEAGWEQAMAWLRASTDRGGVPLEDLAPGEVPAERWGVASAWDHGNLVIALGQRRSRWARYPQKAQAQWFVETDEARSLKVLRRGCQPQDAVRYVVVDAASVSRKFMAWVLLAEQAQEPYLRSASSLRYGQVQVAPATYGEPWRQAVSVRLYYLDGETLRHYRLVYESPDRSCHWFQVSLRGGGVMRTCAPVDEVYAPEVVPAPGSASVLGDGIAHDVSVHASVKVFEVVAGAQVSGRAPAGAQVEVRVALRAAGSGRAFAHRRVATAAADGAWSVVTPYAGRYAVSLRDARANAAVAQVDVGEADVVGGRTVVAR